MNRGKSKAELKTNGMVARLVALNVRDPARYRSLFDDAPSTVNQPIPPPPPLSSPESDQRSSESQVKLSDANLGQLGRVEKGDLLRILRDFVEAGLFLSTPNGYPPASVVS